MSNKDFLKELERKTNKIKKIQAESSTSKTTRSMILDFLNAIDKAKYESADALTYHEKCVLLMDILGSRLRGVDPFVSVNIIYSEESDWKKEVVLRIEVTWSDSYALIKKINKEECFSADDILLELF